MKKLTLKRSLELCKELWTWLRDNPDKIGKRDWPKWYKYKEVEQLCFACEFDLLEYVKNQKVGNAHTTTCAYCPLKGLWGNNCTKESSPYYKWCKAETGKARRKYAGVIANFCDKELKKLAKKEG